MFITRMPNGLFRVSPVARDDGFNEVEFHQDVDLSKPIDLVDGNIIEVEEQREDIEDKSPINDLIDAFIQ